jgi:hypothetical protein
MNKSREPRLRWFQYSLSTLLLAVLLVSIGMSWVAVRMQRARREREAVAAIMELGGWVQYDYDYQVQPSGKPLPNASPPGPAWLRKPLGENFFATVVGVSLENSSCTDADLRDLAVLTQLRWLDLGGTRITDAGLERLTGLTRLQELGLSGTLVTGAGLKHIEGLTQLQLLDLRGTRVTDAGLEHLKGLTQLHRTSL